MEKNIDTKKLVDIYFEPDLSKSMRFFCKKCINPISRKCNRGYGNLVIHVKEKHKDYVEVYREATKKDGSKTKGEIDKFVLKREVSAEAEIIYRWME